MFANKAANAMQRDNCRTLQCTSCIWNWESSREEGMFRGLLSYCRYGSCFLWLTLVPQREMQEGRKYRLWKSTRPQNITMSGRVWIFGGWCSIILLQQSCNVWWVRSRVPVQCLLCLRCPRWTWTPRGMNSPTAGSKNVESKLRSLQSDFSQRNIFFQRPKMP